jgi:predicted  nucleic acid-binding Zn-ribbon protein
MTHLCCASCRLRFTPVAAACLAGCPGCGEALEPLSLEDTFGFRIFTVHDAPATLPEAVAVSLPVPDPANHDRGQQGR